MKALITGGLGYIGSHLVLELEKQGHECIIFDNESKGKRYNLPHSGNFWQGDIVNYNDVFRIFKNNKFDIVFHLAAAISVDESVKHEKLYHEINVKGTINILEAMQATDCKNLVFASTCAIYGDPKYPNKVYPKSPYAKQKLMCEKLIESYSKFCDISAISLRFYNVAGITNKHYSCPESNKAIFPQLMRAAYENRTFDLYGNDYNTKDGTAIRDYVHVDDIVNGLCLAGGRVLDDKMNRNHVENLGSCNGYSNMEIIETINKKLGREIKLNLCPRRPGDVECVIAPKAKLYKWKPKKNLDDIIDSLIETYEMKQA